MLVQGWWHAIPNTQRLTHSLAVPTSYDNDTASGALGAAGSRQQPPTAGAGGRLPPAAAGKVREGGLACRAGERGIASFPDNSNALPPELRALITCVPTLLMRQPALNHHSLPDLALAPVFHLPPPTGRPSYQTSDMPNGAAMQAQYAAIASALRPYVDVLLAETLSTAAEAQAALAAAAHAAPGRLVCAPQGGEQRHQMGLTWFCSLLVPPIS